MYATFVSTHADAVSATEKVVDVDLDADDVMTTVVKTIRGFE